MRSYRGLPSQFWILWLGTLINRAGAFVVPFLALYVTSARGMGEAAAGLVVSAYGAGSLTAAFVGGSLADHIGRRRTMLLSLFGGACPMLAIGFVRPFWAVAAATFAMGALGEMYRPAVGSVVADIVPPQNRTRAYGLMYWAHNLGFALAPSLAGWLSSTGFTTLFAVDAATMVVFGIVVLAFVPETRPAETFTSTTGPSSTRVLLGDRVFMSVVALTFATALVMWQNGVSLPLDMRRTGHSAAAYGYLIAINGALIVFLQPPLTRWLATKNRTKVLCWSSLVFGVGMGLYAYVTSKGGYAFAITVWTVGEIGLLPTLSTVVADLSPTRMRGRYQGASNMAWGLAACVGPMVGGGVLSHFGSATLWVACAVVMLLAAFAHKTLGPQLEATATARRAEANSV